MKRIRNRKFLKAKRMQYSILLGAYRSSIQEFFLTAAELTDEAVFEARVAARVAQLARYGCKDVDTGMECPGWHICAYTQPHPSCAPYLLQWARLQIEEEMDE